MRPILLLCGVASSCVTWGWDVTTQGDTAGDTGIDATEPNASTPAPMPPFVYQAQGDAGAGCLARWDVTHAPSSFLCSSCDFSLDWQHDVQFRYAPDSDVSGCVAGASAADAYVYDLHLQSDGLTTEMNQRHSVWGFSAELGSVVTGSISLGGELVDIQAWPGTWDPVSGAFSFTDPEFGIVEAWGTVRMP